jgi:hypothetical protein
MQLTRKSSAASTGRRGLGRALLVKASALAVTVFVLMPSAIASASVHRGRPHRAHRGVVCSRHRGKRHCRRVDGLGAGPGRGLLLPVQNTPVANEPPEVPTQGLPGQVFPHHV